MASLLDMLYYMGGGPGTSIPKPGPYGSSIGSPQYFDDPWMGTQPVIPPGTSNMPQYIGGTSSNSLGFSEFPDGRVIDPPGIPQYIGLPKSTMDWGTDYNPAWNGIPQYIRPPKSIMDWGTDYNPAWNNSTLSLFNNSLRQILANSPIFSNMPLTETFGSNGLPIGPTPVGPISPPNPGIDSRMPPRPWDSIGPIGPPTPIGLDPREWRGFPPNSSGGGWKSPQPRTSSGGYGRNTQNRRGQGFTRGNPMRRNTWTSLLE